MDGALETCCKRESNLPPDARLSRSPPPFPATPAPSDTQAVGVAASAARQLARAHLRLALRLAEPLLARHAGRVAAAVQPLEDLRQHVRLGEDFSYKSGG